MTLLLEVQPRNDSEPSGVSTLKIQHVSCGASQLSIKRNPATNTYSVVCGGCGLTLEFPTASGLADFERVAIDGVKRRLAGTFTCSSGDTDVWIVGAHRDRDAQHVPGASEV